jgi:hypothetical protein
MNLKTASPSILMSVIVLLSLVSSFDLSSSTVSVASAAHQVTQLRASRLRRRPAMDLQTTQQLPY